MAKNIIPNPAIEAMLLCDNVITEEGTRKKSLIGVFENISTFELPCSHYQLSVYVKFTDACGKYDFNLELVNLRKNKIIGKGRLPKPLNVPDKNRSYQLVFNLIGLVFPNEGKYEFRIFANDKYFGQKRFYVRKIEKPNK